MGARTASARSRLPEMWSAWVWVSRMWLIVRPFLAARRRYSGTRSRPGSTTRARPASVQPIRYERQPDSSLRICWKIIAAYSTSRSPTALVLLGLLAFGLRLFDDLVREEGRDFFIVRELHRVTAAAAGHRAQARLVGQHLGHRHHGPHRGGLARRLHADDPPAAAVQVADDVAGVIRGGRDLHGHDGLEQDRPGVHEHLLEPHRRRDLKRHVGGVHVMGGAVIEGDLHVHHRIAGDYPLLHAVADALLDGGDEVARDRAAEDVVDEFEPAPALHGLDAQPRVAVLAAPPGLLLVLALPLGAPLHRLLVGNARWQKVHIHVVLPLHALDDHLDVQASDTRDEELLRLRIEVVVDRRILLGDPRQRGRDLVLVATRLGLDRERDRRFGKRDLRERERLPLLGERVTRLRLLQLLRDADLTWPQRLDVLLRLALEPGDVAHPFPSAVRRIEERRVGPHGAAHDAEERELANMRIAERLEHQRRDRGLRVRGPGGGLLRLEVRAGDFGAVGRGG